MSRAIDADFEREVGAALLGWIAATRVGRWRGPRGALDYVAVTDGTTEALVRDFVAWATGYSDHLAPGARNRMEALADELLADGALDHLDAAVQAEKIRQRCVDVHGVDIAGHSQVSA